MVIVEFKEEHIREAAWLHVRGIIAGFISSLGVDFVSSLYRTISRSDSSFGFVAQDDGRVLGFVVLTTDIGRLYRTVILGCGLKTGVLLAGRVCSVSRLKKVFETLMYQARTSDMDLPSAELLSIVVAEDRRHEGIGEALVHRGLVECYYRGIDWVKVLVCFANVPANYLYLKSGFELAGRVDSHGVPSNIYVAQTSLVVKEQLPDGLVAASESRAVCVEIFDVPRRTAQADVPSRGRKYG